MTPYRLISFIGCAIVVVVLYYGVVAIAEKIISRAEAAHPLACRELNVTGAECSVAVQEQGN